MIGRLQARDNATCAERVASTPIGQRGTSSASAPASVDDVSKVAAGCEIDGSVGRLSGGQKRSDVVSKLAAGCKVDGSAGRPPRGQKRPIRLVPRETWMDEFTDYPEEDADSYTNSGLPPKKLIRRGSEVEIREWHDTPCRYGEACQAFLDGTCLFVHRKGIEEEEAEVAAGSVLRLRQIKDIYDNDMKLKLAAEKGGTSNTDIPACGEEREDANVDESQSDQVEAKGMAGYAKALVKRLQAVRQDVPS